MKQMSQNVTPFKYKVFSWGSVGSRWKTSRKKRSPVSFQEQPTETLMNDHNIPTAPQSRTRVNNSDRGCVA